MFDIFTDGACIGNPGPGGWAFLIKHEELKNPISGAGGETETTNKRIELFAVIAAFEAFNIKRNKNARCTVHSDSKYVVDAFRQAWINQWQQKEWRTSNKKPVKNKDLWERLLDAVANHEVRWNWAKGHAGHPENEIVDELARKEAERYARRLP